MHLGKSLEILTKAPSAKRSPITFVLSNISLPGPEAKHSPALAGHVEVNKSHELPVREHFGPIIFGDTSPKFEEQKDPTNLPF